MTSQSNITDPTLFSDDFLFGSFLADDDLFGGFQAPSAPISPSLPESKTEFPDIDINQCLQLIGLGNNTAVSSPDLSIGQGSGLHLQEAAQLLTTVESRLTANPALAPAVERLRQSLVAAQASALSPALTVSPTSQNMATPFLASFDFDFGSPSVAGKTPLMPTGADTFVIPWDVPPSATSADVALPEQKPKAKVGRKRKERPNDPAQLLEELDLKRQRNTESARRSRIKRMAELEGLHNSLLQSQENEKRSQERIRCLEAELQKAKKLLALAGEKLKATL